MNCYPEKINETVILPSPSELIWEKFEYFDKRANDYPDNINYEETRDKLFEMWLERFKKEWEK